MKSTKTPERLTKAITLRSSGLSYQKIANELGVSKGTIMDWLDPNYHKKRKLRDKNKSQEYKNAYYQKNKEQILKRHRAYYQDNKESISKWQTTYERNRRRDNIQRRLSCNLRTRLYCAITRGSKAGSAVKDLGCSIDELKQHLESKFQEGMTWDNYGAWHIDHVKPLASFDLTDRDQFLEACHYTNLQPLWAEDNLKKSNM